MELEEFGECVSCLRVLEADVRLQPAASLSLTSRNIRWRRFYWVRVEI